MGRKAARTESPEGRRPRGTAKDRALRLLGVRWRSREELRRRLSAAGFDPEEIEQALVGLERVGLIDDERFALEVVRDQSTRRLSGDRAIMSSLRQKGVEASVADRALGAAGDEEARARDLALRRVGRLGGLGPEAAGRRLYGLLVRRGFAGGVATEACRAALEAHFGNGDLAQDGGPEDP